jgi:predicted  nucleic acid-binding Zn-ribbon protein
MSAALGLYRLQQVDSRMDQIQARLNAIRETLENDLDLRAAIDIFAAAESKSKEMERVLKHSEAEVEKQRSKIEQAEATLYSGKVQNPKELQDLQKDISSLKRHLETLEERELEAMINAEAAQKVLQAAEENLERIRSNLSNQSRDLTRESETLIRNRERLESERRAVITDLEDQAVRMYDQLRKQKRGLAIATISDSSCAACGTTLTPSQQQSARSATQLFHCPTCGRILYAD